MFGATNTAGSATNPNNDCMVEPVPDDSISSLAWSQTGLLAAGAWDGTVRVWAVNDPGMGGQIQSQPKAEYRHNQAPCLCVSWSRDGSVLFSGGCDNRVLMKNVQTNSQEQQIGQHDASVNEIFWVEELKMCITGSWDKTIRFWDGQSPQPKLTLQTQGKIFTMSVAHPLMVVGLEDRVISVYDLNKVAQGQTQPVSNGQTALKMQTRVVSAFPDCRGYAVGSIEGRCSIVYLGSEQDSKKNFAFKCHRTTDEIFAVNDISFNSAFGTFATAGGDGTFVFWDKDNKQRLKAFNKMPGPITATAFNPIGNMFAYAVSYDWQRGHEHNYGDIPRRIYIHRVQEDEVRPKRKQ